MQSELVERRGWISHGSFMAGLNFAMLLPGPEAQQLATYIGWRLHGLKGALSAGILFVAPGAVLLALLAGITAAHGKTAWVAGLFDGFRPVVVAIIAAALWRLARRNLKNPAAAGIALAAFAALALLNIPFPWVVGAALVIGAASRRFRPGLFAPAPPPETAPETGAKTAPGTHQETGPKTQHTRRLFRLCALFAVLWAVPVVAVIAWLGWDPWAGIAALFTKAAFVTFGGAYAVLPYVAGEAVDAYKWIAPGDMINGLALAETTPGPLILVTQWIGWFAGYHQPGALSPIWGGVMGAALTTYVTFLPCFLFILAGAPYVERVTNNPYAGAALGAVTAAVVGVVASLGVYIGRAALFPGAARGDWLPDPFAAGLMLAALGGLLFTRIGIPWIVLAGGAAGLTARALGLSG
ncbi:MAG: chromate transporter [Alphaproteobacteria bacterium]|jgi:chromate transporter